MSEPRVSCIIPVFNGERYIAEAIQCVREQTAGEFEIIVVDDGSTDRSAEVTESCGPGIVCLRQDNAGPAVARNRGLAHSRGEFVTFLDADDLWHQDKTRRQLTRLRERPELGASFTLVKNFWDPAATEEERRSRRVEIDRVYPGYVMQCMLARREVFDVAGCFDGSLCHSSETDWILRAEAKGVVFEMLQEVLVYRRLHGDNTSKRHARASQEEYLHLLKASLDRRRQDAAADQRVAEPQRRG